MALYRRPGSSHWQVEFTLKGQRFRRSSGTNSKRRAATLERQWRAEVYDQATLGRAPSMTIEEAIDRYWNTVILPKGKQRSAQNTLYILDRIRSHFGPGTMLDAIDKSALSNFSDGLLAAGLAPSTVNRNLTVIKAVFSRAHREWGTLRSLPHIAKKPVQPETTRYLTEAEEQRLLAASPGYLRDLLVFLLGTGARLREATHLEWRNVHFGKQASVRFVETKGGKPRGVPLPNAVRDLLIRLRDNAPDGEDRVFLFLKRDGTRVPFDNPRKAFWAARERAGLDDVRLHDMRHTYASRLVQRGVGLYEVQQLLGHSTPAQTQRYASLAPENLQRAVAVLNQ